MNELRLMVWNWLEGGHLRGQPQRDPHRVRCAQAVVNRYTPDILVINEALWCEPYEGYQADYAELFGFPYQVGHLYDKEWGNVILSRYPIEEVREFGIYNRGALLAVVKAPWGHVEVATYHPHPSRYADNKAMDYELLLSAFHPELPGLLCGDFNAIDPSDQVDVEKLVQGFKAFSPRPQEDAQRFLEAGQTIFPVLHEHGWQDVLGAARQPTMPTRLIAEKGTEDLSAMRIDHLRARLPDTWVLEEVRVINEEEAHQASDHLPLWGRWKIGT